MEQWSVQLAPQLRALVALASAGGHMTRAAADLNIPQSSMSRKISALQSALGVPLLIHDGRAVRLTPDAHQLAVRLRGPLDELDLALAEASGSTDPERGTVRFGFPLTMGSGRIPDLLAEFRHRHPNIKVLLKQANGSELGADLLSGDLDLAIVIPTPERLNHVEIGKQAICVVLPAGHHLATATELRLDQLDGDTFIANPPSYNLRQITEYWCRSAGYDPDIAIEVTEFATIRELIGRDLGIALLPHDDRNPSDIVEIPLAGHQYRRTIALAWGTSTQSAPTRQLHEYLVNGWGQDEV
ncbi:LysR substrate-binding domain-containing protein [Williamsia sp.]|uniref:LysR substrate-binding domain-containing protein n=1 Tax=Williamsia sp. TaxID=1872085 RepID=UPI001A19A0A2|nr:LysR substrate-binding domain-containing protein [Williamsia sp.]MBJ7291816.1 LysR family transcriptional regulator [Williamsia sp.]